ncbi:putative peptidoglycan D,D-transpeptidase PenA [Rubrivivax sp. A210]|uniref:peptidoglycan D,D-transpeptidase FtsI family protein n=1 Tax=Rubrivivax sp. A210 TaxID=2772301 RepID=UPI00191AC88A|nr:penicillin-binding protein 2 [Rubrivivax sp. A210]CAD5370535.1 putative peptidoglycan D,D-transpeptidase PenA [Rubrivivax sp. A210]
MSRSTANSVRSVNYATSPLLASKTPPWRSRFVVFLVGLAFLVLFGRAIHLQIWATDFYKAQGEKRFVHKQALPASRGRIVDRNGLVLATSVALPSVQVDTKLFAADAAQRRLLARLLAMTPAELDDRLAVAGGTVMLRRHLEEAAWQQVKALGLKGVSELREYKRRYPEGEAAAHVVGFTNIDDVGQEGIELGFQSHLLGQAGQRTVLRDRLGRVVEDVGDQADPVHGRDITLAIDSKVQFFAWQRMRDAVKEHKAKAGSVVVIDTRTGEVLALANYPSYDPADRSNLSGAQLRNRALTDVFEPGSTMKPLVVALALETGRVKVDTVINTAPGSLVVGPLVVRDAHPHGALTVQEVIQKSSNIGAARIAMQMPARELWELFSGVGYGQKPQIAFPGVVTGRLKPHKNWRPVEQATMAYGYGLSASLLQMARAYTPLARDGDVIPLTLLRPEAGLAPVQGHKVLSPATVYEVRKMLQMAAGPGGTATKAQTIGYSVGGKSGTAHKQEGKGYASNKYRAWFVGMAPIVEPRIIVAVMVDEPSNGKHYGGDVAAPVFSQVVQQTLRMMNVTPDIDVKAQISAKPVAAEPESF